MALLGLGGNIALRLLVPFNISLEAAPVKVELPQQEMVITRSAQEESLQQTPVISADDTVKQNIMQNSPSLNPDGTGIKVTAPAETKQAAKEYSFSLVGFGAALWIFGAAAALGWNFFAYFRFCNRVMPWNRAVSDEHIKEVYNSLCEEMGVKRRPEIYINKLIKSPMMTGYGSPKILLPAQELESSDCEVVLRHELTHHKRHDLWYKLLLAVARSLHWFNPVVYMMCKRADNDIEISCDESVVRQKDLEFRKEYCETILRIMRNGGNRPLMLSTGFYGGAAVLKKRFSAVLKENSKRGATLFAAAIILIAFCGTLVACKSGAESAPQQDDSSVVASSQGAYENSSEDEVCPLPAVTGPDGNGVFPEIEGYLFDRWVTYGEDETVKPDESKIAPFMESKYCIKWLSEVYPDIDDWEVLFEKDIYTLREDMYDPYTYSWRDQFAPNRITVLKTGQGKGFDRLIVVSIEEYVVTVSDSGLIPSEQAYCYKIETRESEIAGGDFSGAETVGLENWYPTIWLKNENRALLLDFNMAIAVNVSGIESEPPVVEFVYKLKNGFYLNDNKTKFSTVPENENDMIIYLKSQTDPEHYAARIVYYDYETKSLVPFEDGEPDDEQSSYYTQAYFLTDSVLCLLNENHMTLYDIMGEELGKPFAELGGDGGAVSENKITLMSVIASDRDFGNRHAIIYRDGENSEYHILTFGTDGKLISNFPTGLAGGSIGSYNFASGVLYFTYYSDGSGYGGTHYSVDTRPTAQHILEALD